MSEVAANDPHQARHCGCSGNEPAVNDSPELRSAALLQAMTRLRDGLDRIPADADLDAPVTLTVRDAVLIARRLLTPLR